MANGKNNLMGGDERLRHSAGNRSSDREASDNTRTQTDGTITSAEERRRMLRQEWVQEILPTPPELPGYHLCWLSTNNANDPIYKRQQLGYELVKCSELPGFEAHAAKEGSYEGGIQCNEMVLFKLPLERYNDLMTIYHYDMPQEAEGGLREQVNTGMDQEDRDGRRLGTVEGFDSLGRRRVTPTFISA